MPDLPANMGLAGWVISGLVTVVGALGGAIVFLYKGGNDASKARIADNAAQAAALQKLLVDTHAALHEIIEASKKRNESTEKLSALIAELSGGFRLFTEQFRFQQETTQRDLDVAIEAVKALAESVRVLADDNKRVLSGVSVVQATIDVALKTRR